MMELFSRHWLELFVLSFIIISIIYGYYVGFLKIALSMLSLILTIALVNFSTPYVSDFLRNNTDIEEVIQKKLVSVMTGNVSTDELSIEEQSEAIDKLEYPENIKDYIKDNNNATVWDYLGVDRFVDYITGYLSTIIFNVISFVFMFIVIWILFQILISFTDVFTKVSVIHGINRVAGAVCGLLYSLTIVWIFLLFITVVVATKTGSTLMGMIEDSIILGFLYKFNPIVFLLRNLLFL